MVRQLFSKAGFRDFLRKKAWIIASLLAGLLALWVIFSQISFKEVLSVFSHATLLNVVGYLVSVTIILFMLAFRWKIILESQGISIGLGRLLWYRLVGYGVSFFTPTAKVGGEPVRAALLTRHGVPFKEALSTVVIDKTIELSSSGLYFVIGAPVLLLTVTFSDRMVWLIIIVALLFLLLIAHFYYSMLNGHDYFGKILRLFRIHRTRKGRVFARKLKSFESLIIDFHHRDRKHFFWALIVSFISLLLMFLEYGFALRVLGVSDFSLSGLFLIFSFVGISYIIPIPMALGSLEAGQLSAFKIIGLGSATAVALSFLVRTKDLFIGLLGLLALTFFGLKPGPAIEESSVPVSKEFDRLKNLK